MQSSVGLRGYDRVRGYDRIRADLEEQLPFAEADFRAIAGSRIFITGGTGFVGRWLLESLLHANERLQTGIRMAILTRSPENFALQYPHLADVDSVELIEGDVRDIPSNVGTFDGCIHAATPASAVINRDQPLEMLDTIVDGGRAVLEVVARAGKVPFLFTSTGAVYGPQPADLMHVPETRNTGGADPLNTQSAYAEGKRVGELQCAIYAKTHGVQAKVARLFAFVGPYLPLDLHFAVGNFIRDTIADQAIVLTGDGSTVRSYQYAAETVTWLWAVYARGEVLRPYNVGAEEAVSTAELARLISEYGAGRKAPEIRGVRDEATPVDRYVPSTERIRMELGVQQTISMREGIERTFAFHATA